jgi:hypothetical protein
VLLAAVLGLAFALLAAPRRMVMPFVLLASGIGTFVLIGIAGASVIERYLAVAAVGLLVFAAVCLGGFTMLGKGRLRTAWMAASVALVIFGVGYTATQVRLDYFDNELTFRGDAHDDLVRVLESEGVRRGLECGPLTLPNHKLVPDARWIAGLPADRVIPRADRDERRPRRGVALIVTSRFAIFKHAWTSDADSPLVQMPPPGFRPVSTGDFYSAYARC